MVIGPEELKQRIRQSEQQAYEAVEQKIDKSLEERFDGIGSVTFGSDTFKGIRRFALDDLFDKYRKAGWSVREMHDQRDGNYVQFTYQNRQDHYDIREAAAHWHSRV